VRPWARFEEPSERGTLASARNYWPRSQRHRLAEIVPFPKKPAQLSVIFRVEIVCPTCRREDTRTISVLKPRDQFVTAEHLRRSGLLEATFNGPKPPRGCRFCPGEQLIFGEITPRAPRGLISNPPRLARAHLNLKLSRLSWSTVRLPISFMSRSISARRFPRALSTPAWPAAARAYR
jgi:hypothetical protein